MGLAVLVFLIASSASAQADAVCGSPTFSAAAVYSVGTEPYGIVTSDLNNDGILDLAVANRFGAAVNVLLGTGGGQFAAATTIPLSGTPFDLAVADFNGDGKPDLAVADTANFAGPGQVFVLLGTGTGAFNLVATVPAGIEPRGIATGNFVGDGHVDIAVATGEPKAVLLIAGDGAGGFAAPVVLPLLRAANALTAADLNGDGRLDLAAATLAFLSMEGFVEVRLAAPSGGFLPGVSYPIGVQPMAILATDLNGDGRLDLATASVSDDTVSVLLGNGAGGFGAQAVFPVGDEPQSVGAADVNGDGHVDLLTLGRGVITNPSNINAAVTMLLGDGAGGFGPPAEFQALGSSGLRLAVGDFNGDGKPDVAATASTFVSVLTNMCGREVDLSVVVTDSPDPVRSGHPLVYDVVVTNHGPDAAFAGLETVLPSGLSFVAAVASQGTCLEVGYPHRIRCFLGELSGTAPGNSATVALTFTAGASGVVSYSVSGVAGGFDPNPGDNAETETTRVGVLGGETLRIQTAAGGGASLEWRSGDIQAGYFVGRRAGGATTILPSGGVPLPAAATSFTDPAPAGGQNNCYVVAPVDGGGAAMARSDMLCLIPGTASPSGVPPNFRLELRQSPTARLTWSHPGGQSWYIVAIYPQGGGAPSSETLPGTRNTAQYNTGGVPTCYVLYAGTGTTEIGHTDALCAVPGVSTLRK